MKVALDYYFSQLNIQDQTLYWFFSTVAQSLVALVALYGVVVVFKLQVISSQISEFLQTGRLKELLKVKSASWSITSTSQRIEDIKDTLKVEKEPTRREELISAKKELEGWQKSRGNIKKSMLYFSGYTLLVVSISLIFLSISELIFKSNLAVPSLLLVLLLSFTSFLLLIHGIKSLFNE